MDHDHHDHMHHHDDIVVTTATMMTHVHEMMKQQTNTSSAHSAHGSNVHDMIMAMTFHGGFKEQILFEQWHTQTMGAFIGSWLLIFFVAVLYEGLKTVRDQLLKRDGCPCGQERERQPSLLHHQGQQYDNSNNNNDLIPRVQTVKACTHKRARLLSLNHLIQTILHILQMGISYLLMLIAMTFNIYLFAAIILGAGLGHFLFAWRRMFIIDYNEHCH
ncbi:unnamed protein product [Rotaria sp. Silwood1]|nr:unnamed protein product [Rotaria sp. Silwood1]CAF3380655.1 unnamed protein product [Rotaria sp. Silwood1]CAF4860177.1 unnamed protein product [Rotaria sp. Silwood1]